jgi:hypothetical protein
MEKVAIEQWAKLSDEKKARYRSGERFKTSMAMMKDKLDIGEKSFYNPTILLDFI